MIKNYRTKGSRVPSCSLSYPSQLDFWLLCVPSEGKKRNRGQSQVAASIVHQESKEQGLVIFNSKLCLLSGEAFKNFFYFPLVHLGIFFGKYP